MQGVGHHATILDQHRPDEDNYVHAKRGALSKAANEKIRRDYDRTHFEAANG
jgi:hypothetical protein